MTRARLALLPRDGLFVKDPRGWFASGSGRARTLEWPTPTMLLGALRTLWGRTREQAGGQAWSDREWVERTAGLRLVRSVALRRRISGGPEGRDTPWTAMFPVPQDARYVADASGHPRVERLTPRPSEERSWTLAPEGGLRFDWPMSESMAKPIARPAWWPLETLTQWLTGRDVEPDRHAVQRDTPIRRTQVQVAIDPETFAAQKGMLFASEVIEPLTWDGRSTYEWAVGVEIEHDGEALEDWTRQVATIAGDRRLAQVEMLDESMFAVPTALLDALDGKESIALVVTSPLLFSNGWRPDGFEPAEGWLRGVLRDADGRALVDGDIELRSAIMPRPVHVSGWNTRARAPRPTSRFVAPGAVYYLKKTSGRFGRAEAERLWLSTIDSAYSVAERAAPGSDMGGVPQEHMRMGLVVPGVWLPGPPGEGVSA